MQRFMRVVTAIVLVLIAGGRATSQVRQYPLESAEALTLHNVTATPAVLQGSNGLRVTVSDEGKRQQGAVEQLARIKDLEFSNGVIEVELAGVPASDAPEGARGFVGIAFRLQPDNQTYDAFYLRPTNGRAEDQERRNHAVQYISHPQWTWSRLRKETPSKYESYVDLQPGVWTRIRIEVRGAAARLFVHDNEQPTLIVNDVKSGAQGKGAVALWIDAGTVAHFRNLRVTPGK
jgi:3-keto-disaccharide hydrolase